MLLRILLCMLMSACVCQLTRSVSEKLLRRRVFFLFECVVCMTGVFYRCWSDNHRRKNTDLRVNNLLVSGDTGNHGFQQTNAACPPAGRGTNHLERCGAHCFCGYRTIEGYTAHEQVLISGMPNIGPCDRGAWGCSRVPPSKEHQRSHHQYVGISSLQLPDACTATCH